MRLINPKYILEFSLTLQCTVHCTVYTCTALALICSINKLFHHGISVLIHLRYLRVILLLHISHIQAQHLHSPIYEEAVAEVGSRDANDQVWPIKQYAFFLKVTEEICVRC